MVKLISKISTGSKMDQIYLPKVRPPGFAVGDSVEIIPTAKENIPFYTHHVNQLEPIKSIIKDEILSYFEHADNAFITGSFLEEGFNFHDIDVVVLGESESKNNWSNYFTQKLGLPVQIISLDRKSLQQGLQQDPLFQMMMSKYLARKREIFKYKNRINYKLLDLHLLKSKTLIDNFDILTGKEKYNLVRNLLAIDLFLKEKNLERKIIEREMEKSFGKDTPRRLKENMVEKNIFLPKFRKKHGEIFHAILRGIKNEPQPK